MTSGNNKNKTVESFCYLMFDGVHYKIGKSINPEKRLKEIKTGNPKCKLIAYGTGRTEKQLHEIFKKHKVGGEWFKLKEKQVALICRLLENKYTGRDMEICADLRAEQLREQDYDRYIIKFGKYKGKKICEMVGEEDITYLIWAYNWAMETHPVFSKNIEVHLGKMGYTKVN